MITSILNSEKIVSSSSEAFTMNEKSSFGEKKNQKIEYSLVEASYLLQNDKMEIYSNNKKLTLDNFMKKAKKMDKKIELKLIVYNDLRKKGYIVKSALKFGAEFRVYEKGVRPGKDHSKWILYTTKEHSQINWHDFAAKSRVAHSTKKNLLIALVDDESDITYYEVAWLKA